MTKDEKRSLRRIERQTRAHVATLMRLEQKHHADKRIAVLLHYAEAQSFALAEILRLEDALEALEA